MAGISWIASRSFAMTGWGFGPRSSCLAFVLPKHCAAREARGPVRLVGLSSGCGADQVPEGGVGVVGGGEVGAVGFQGFGFERGCQPDDGDAGFGGGGDAGAGIFEGHAFCCVPAQALEACEIGQRVRFLVGQGFGDHDGFEAFGKAEFGEHEIGVDARRIGDGGIGNAGFFRPIEEIEQAFQRLERFGHVAEERLFPLAHEAYGVGIEGGDEFREEFGIHAAGNGVDIGVVVDIQLIGPQNLVQGENMDAVAVGERAVNIEEKAGVLVGHGGTLGVMRQISRSGCACRGQSGAEDGAYRRG